jgi:DNA-binding phage protein
MKIVETSSSRVVLEGEAQVKTQTALTNHDLWLNEQLQDVGFAAEFLNAAMEDDDPQVYLLALRKLVDARCGIKAIAEQYDL